MGVGGRFGSGKPQDSQIQRSILSNSMINDTCFHCSHQTRQHGFRLEHSDSDSGHEPLLVDQFVPA